MKSKSHATIALLAGLLLVAAASAAVHLGGLYPSQRGPSSPQGAEPAQRPADEALAFRSWVAGGASSLLTSPPSRDAVQLFLASLLTKEEEVHLCDFQFADLHRSGTYQLVASIDASGRDFCNAVMIVARKDTGFSRQTLPAWGVERIADVLRDLNADGMQELVIPQPLSQYEGARCMALWTAVYAWDGRHYAPSGSRFPEVYRVRLQSLTKDIEQIQELPAGQLREGNLSCYYLEQDKIYRFLALDATAGFNRALEWMKSADPSLRRKAVIVFGDIRDGQSLENLKVLANDPDVSVSQMARETFRAR